MRHIASRKAILLAFAATSALCFGTIAQAQEAGDPIVPPEDAAPVAAPVDNPPTANEAAVDTSNQLEDIVVTAEKRSTSLQDVPIAITALSAETLSQAKVDTTSQLTQVTPNLVVSGVYENVLKITLRGVGTNDFVQNLNPAVATYIDEVYMGLATGQALQFFDLERVEILRGPQGTLYGKNATGGAISYFSKRPSTKGFEAGVNATFGNYDRTEADGFVNLPLSDIAALRISGSIKDRNGFFHNEFLRIKQRAANSKAARVQLLLKPNENLTANFKVFASEFDGDVPHRQPIGMLDPVNLGRFLVGGVNIHGFPTLSNPHHGETDILTFDDSTNTGASAHIAYDMGAVTLTSISAYEKNKRQARDDPDGSRIDQIDNSYFNNSDYISQEIRLSGDIGRIDYVIGGHFYREEIDARLHLRLFGCTLETPPCPFLPVGIPGYPTGPYIPGGPLVGRRIGFLINTTYTQNNRSLAGFGDVKFHLSDALTLTGGLRYTTERRSIDASSTNPLLDDLVTPTSNPAFRGYNSFSGKETWNEFSGRAVIDYKFADSMVYASLSRGFRAGNWNGLGFTLATISQPVDPETLMAYEVGIKSELLDRRVKLNLTGFYYNYDDLQVSIFVNTTPTLSNAAAARIYGGELEAAALVTEGLTVRFAGGYTNSEYQDFNDGRGNDLSGNTLVNTPRWTATGGFTYERPLNDRLKLQASTDIRYQSRVYFNAYNDSHLAQDGYALVNGRVGLDIDDRYSIAVWARNLFDKNFNTDGQSQRAPFGEDSIVFGEPRMYGVTASAKFR